MKKEGKEFYIKDGERPKVLLLGNGLNRTGGQNSWSEFLKAIKDDVQYPLDPEAYIMPMGLKAAMLSGGNLDKKIKKYVDDKLKRTYCCDNQTVLDLVSEYVELPFDYILTTNYSYEIEMALSKRQKLCDNDMKKMMCHTEGKKAESKYMLKTYNEVGGRQIWHIHGEFRKPNSVVLGQYYYGNLLCRYDQILSSHSRSYVVRKKKGVAQRCASWVDAFLLGDVYIVGLDMNFAETDLWWLLEKKSNWKEKGIVGSTVYFELAEDEKLHCQYDKNIKCDTIGHFVSEKECKLNLLKAYGVRCENLGIMKRDNSDYLTFYKAVAKKLRDEI